MAGPRSYSKVAVGASGRAPTTSSAGPLPSGSRPVPGRRFPPPSTGTEAHAGHVGALIERDALGVVVVVP